MDAEPVLSKLAMKLDPCNRDAVVQFKRIANYLMIDLPDDQRHSLVEQLAASMVMLELASITGDADIKFRSKFITAAGAVDRAVGKFKTTNGSGAATPLTSASLSI